MAWVSQGGGAGCKGVGGQRGWLGGGAGWAYGCFVGIRPVCHIHASALIILRAGCGASGE